MGEDLRGSPRPETGGFCEVKASVLTRAEKAEGWRAPGSDAGWMNPIVERFLLHLLVKKELRVRYRGSVLGLSLIHI